MTHLTVHISATYYFLILKFKKMFNQENKMFERIYHKRGVRAAQVLANKLIQVRR